MNSVDLSSPDNLINWHHPDLSQNHESWNFIKEILAEFTNTFGKLKNCNTENVDRLRTRVQQCDNAGAVSCDENIPKYSFYCTKFPCKRLFIRIANFFFFLLSNKNDVIEQFIINSSTDGKRFVNNLIIEKLTVKNGIGQCTSSGIYARVSDFDLRIPKNEWECDDLRALSGKIKNYLENSVLSAQTTSTPPVSGTSSNSGQSNTGPQNSNSPIPSHNRSFVLLGGTAVIGGGLAYAGYRARQAQIQKTKDGSTQSLQRSTNLRA